MDRAGGQVLALRSVTAPAGRPRREAPLRFVQRNSWEFKELGGRAESPRKQGGRRDLGPGDWQRPLIARIIQYFGAGRSSDSPGRRPAKRAQLNWANPCQNGTSPVLELRGARTSSHASIPGAALVYV